jgi:hypothetical protein
VLGHSTITIISQVEHLVKILEDPGRSWKILEKPFLYKILEDLNKMLNLGTA